MFIWCEYPSAQILSNTRCPKEKKTELNLSTPKNARVYAQIALREFEEFTVNGVTFDGALKGEYLFTENVVFNDGVPYPDKLSDARTLSVPANKTQVVLIELTVGEACAKTEAVTVTVLTDKGDFACTLIVTVFDLTLPNPKDSKITHDYFFDPVRYFPKEAVKAGPTFEGNTYYLRYSNEHFAVLKSVAEKLAEIRCNCVNFRVLALLTDSGSHRNPDGTYYFDFTLFDRVIDVFLQNASLKYISIGHIVRAVDGGEIESFDESGKAVWYGLTSPEADAWAKSFYTEIYRHFAERRLTDKLIISLQDEPHTSESWYWAKARVAEFMPGIRTVEALDTHSVAKELCDCCDIFVPRLEVFEEEPGFYAKMQAQGKEAWVYSCCYPEEPWWLNRFIDLPHCYTRMLCITAKSVGVTGFLHWGSTIWENGFFGLNGDARFKGDGYIFYPDFKNTRVTMSMRGVEAYLGFVDWEVLNALSDKNPELALSLAQKVGTAFDSFTNDLSGTVLEEVKRAALENL